MAMSIDEQIEAAGQLVIRARIYHDLWWFFRGGDTRPLVVNTMQSYPSFFRFTEQAHLVSFIIKINGLFEKRTDSINFVRLVNDVRSLVPTADMAAIDAIIDKAKPTVKKVTLLRNNVFAHRNAVDSYNDWFRKVGVSPDQLRELTEHARSIANGLLRAKRLQEIFFNPRPESEAKSILWALEDPTPPPSPFQPAD